MASHKHPLFVSLNLKGMVQEHEEKSYSDRALWNNVLQGTRQRVMTTTTRRSGVVLKNKKRADGKGILKKRRRSLQFGARRENNGIRRTENNGIRRRVRTLKRLIPISDSKAVGGLDGLFRETADYILSLQSRVTLMQMMVKALADSAE